jgi:hypothetical protein
MGIKVSVAMGAIMLGLAALPARAGEVVVAGDAVADGTDQDSKGVVLVIGGAARSFGGSSAGSDGNPDQRTYFRLEMTDDLAILGAYDYQASESSFDPTGATTMSLGANLSLDDWTVGIGWANGDDSEVLIDLGGDADNVVSFTTSYSVKPGIRIDGLLEYRDDEAVSPNPDDGTFAVGIGTLINF